MRVEGEPFIRRLDEDAAPATHALFGELLLPLKSTYVLNHRVAEDDIEAARLKIGSASIADNVNSPRRFIWVVVHVEDGDLRAISYHGPVESAASHIQHRSSLVDGKPISKQGHATFTEVLKNRPIEGVNVHRPPSYRITFRRK